MVRKKKWNSRQVKREEERRKMNNVKKETLKELGKHFELSVVSPLTNEAMLEVTKKSIEYNLRGVYSPTFQLELVKEALKGSGLKLGGAVSFPLGADTAEAKAFIAKDQADKGVDFLDFVINYWALRAGMVEVVEKEVKMIREAVPNIELKMILEVCFLTDEQIITACKIAADNHIDVVKSSTGQYDGPTMEQACLIVDECKKYGMKSKVAGVKAPRPQNAYAYLCAGIDYIGTQQAFDILDGIVLLREREIF